MVIEGEDSREVAFFMKELLGSRGWYFLTKAIEAEEERITELFVTSRGIGIEGVAYTQGVIQTMRDMHDLPENIYQSSKPVAEAGDVEEPLDLGDGVRIQQGL